jgi:hypothetical protein
MPQPWYQVDIARVIYRTNTPPSGPISSRSTYGEELSIVPVATLRRHPPSGACFRTVARCRC